MDDVLIVGAGISGIGMACHLRMNCPGKSFTILERRQRIGGTWDLFKYPGIRSDADMFTFGYGFKRWKNRKILGSAEAIRAYLEEAAEEHKVSETIRFGQQVTEASWSSEACCWTVTTRDEGSGESLEYKARFLVMGSGYYNHDAGFNPTLPEEDAFGGQIIHPQHWPENIDYRDKKVVVIGSGATAVTLVPAMAKKAAHVTMLQRSPTYVISIPEHDRVSPLLNVFLSEERSNELIRGFYIRLFETLWGASRRYPKLVRKLLMKLVERQVGKENMVHFNPKYDPWDQRLCLVPRNDLFKTIRSGDASVETGHIDHFTEKGIRLTSGRHIDADIVVKATGLELQMLGGAKLSVDGIAKDISELMQFNGALIQDLPNFSWIFGYVSYPWTLKADLVAKYVCRLINHMDEKSYSAAIPVDEYNCTVHDAPFIDVINAGYVKRGQHCLPRKGSRKPWLVLNDYRKDCVDLLENPIEVPELKFLRFSAVTRERPVQARQVA